LNAVSLQKFRALGNPAVPQSPFTLKLRVIVWQIHCNVRFPLIYFS
jgi:hypothetical protein